ncbi:hypothetical protein HanXRQr2_Chr03g0132511 [Helianthus annuus]|uniref:Uncharacterized protein n=1 Tax=Helianthus annuus TaxID=4232 RepID=A0A9K3JK51_HELAN|nr:hypothetical protein HanXRQr2_Chr03g0132511 [Helianthus annuus]
MFIFFRTWVKLFIFEPNGFEGCDRMGAVRLLVGVCLIRVMVVLGPYPFKSPQSSSSVAATCKLYVGGVLDYGVWKVVWSLEKILDHVWSFLYVNQAGGLEGLSDASSVSVKESRLMRNSQPIYVTRWLATCCCAEGLLETLLVMLHKLRTNL